MSKANGKRQGATLPKRFKPRFWEDADRRFGSVRTVISKYEELKKSVGVDSMQKDILVRRAAFIMVELETMELARAEGGPFERSVHTQMVNCLQGLLKQLGIERHAEAAPSLRDYVGGKR